MTPLVFLDTETAVVRSTSDTYDAITNGADK